MVYMYAFAHVSHKFNADWKGRGEKSFIWTFCIGINWQSRKILSFLQVPSGAVVDFNLNKLKSDIGTTGKFSMIC